MHRLIIAVLSVLFSITQVHAADPTCEARAAEKKLAGAAKASFLKKCEAEARGAGGDICAALADDKKLYGAARASYIKKCESDPQAAALSGRCEAAAGERKLHGAARDSFMKKCLQDGGR